MEQTDVFWFWIAAIMQNLPASFIGVLFGLGFVHFFISVRNAKEILAEPADPSVFLKGVRDLPLAAR